MNYGSKHATVQNEVLRTNACMFIVCLVEHIRVDIWSVRESLLPLLQTEAQVSLLQFRRSILWNMHQLREWWAPFA